MDHMTLQWNNLGGTELERDKQLQSDWDRLNATRGNLPFMSAGAIALALRVFGSGSERLLVGRGSTEVEAMFLLKRAKAMQWETFQPSQLPLGAWVADARHDLHGLALELVRGQLGSSLGLSVTQIDPLVAERKPDTDRVRHSDYIDTGWVALDEFPDFDSYWAARGKNLRQNMRKQRNKLAAEGVALAMKVFREPGDMALAIKEYGDLESSGWKAASGTSIHPDNAQGRFYRALLEEAARQGEAAVYKYLFDDKVVAVNLCLQRGETLIVLKTTYDESIKQFSPAFLLRENELQEIYREGKVKRIEYFGRMMDWHTKLTDNKRTVYHLTVYRWPLLMRLAEMRRNQLVNSQTESSTDESTKAEP
jgi:CelD/BcsL family acetyltransferase involved in cellulose biosynthesis